MNDLVEQFLIECRELIQQASDDLLTLEGDPGDRDPLDSAFRAFHTLKGAAGIVSFPAMGRVLHAAEDLLAAARAGDEAVTPSLIGDGLACLDQVGRWLDTMAITETPPLDADADADALMARFGKASPTPTVAAGPAPTARDWLAELVAAHPASPATLAIRYAPPADVFFRGEDPLAIVARLPGLIAVESLETGPLPPLADLDPFRCSLAFGVLADCPREAAAAIFEGVLGDIEITSLGSSAGGAGLSPAVVALLEAQIALLAVSRGDGRIGRIGSVGRVAANVLTHAGRAVEATRLRTLAAGAVASGEDEALLAALRQTLAGDPATDPSPGPAQTPAAPEAARTLRVDVERIDRLVALTGEFMVAKTAVGHAAALSQGGGEPAELARLLRAEEARLGRLVDALQRAVLDVRVLPMRHLFQRFPRLLREMVVSLGKPAHLVTEGAETEADKALVEGLFEPVLHVLRNALGHGVEPAAARAEAGKPAAATIRMSAARRGDHVVLEVADDGGGVDLERVRAAARRRGVASAEALAAMEAREVLDLVFAPGLSTAREVTDISGRGVGMDAVKAAVERLGGRVAIESRGGQGTTVRFTLPFAVMISRVLMVEAGGQMFGIPVDAVVETARVDRALIAPIGAGRAFVHRGRAIPVIDLPHALGAREGSIATEKADLLVVEADGERVALEVDRLGEGLDVMLKPMEGLLAGMPGVAGATLLGDGRVLIVLDPQGLIQ